MQANFIDTILAKKGNYEKIKNSALYKKQRFVFSGLVTFFNIFVVVEGP